MYVHIGNEKILKSDDIVAILDVETLKQSRNNLRILNMLQNQICEPKSVILAYNAGKIKEYFSVVSTNTIKNRMWQIQKE